VSAPLARALGDDRVVTDPGLCARFACSGVVPGCVLFPRTVEEVGAAVRAAAEARLAIVPCGNATHLGVGNPPRRYDAALSVKFLDRVVAHEAGDMTVTVEAGLTVAGLDAALASAGQWLPLDPPCPDRMTIGGLVAADRSGPARLAHGKVRDSLIGCRVVTADGTVVKGGGRVVKNVAGYDLPKLFTGSYGTLGVIVEATFKVRPRPVAERVWVWPASSLDEVLRRGLAVLESGLAPALVEAANEEAAVALGLDRLPALIVGLAGAPSLVAAQTARLETIAGRDGAELLLSDEVTSARRLRALRDFPLDPAAGLVVRSSALPSALPAIVPELERAARRTGYEAAICAQAGNGVVWLKVARAQPDADALARLQAFVVEARRMATQGRAALIVESMPHGLHGRIDPWGAESVVDARAMALMAGVKKSLDPAGTFAPGRFVGGI
jgi:glycolate oxidase FAD binding subunit